MINKYIFVSPYLHPSNKPNMETAMKKFSVLLIFILRFSASHAQIQVGFKAGYNLSSFIISVPSNFYTYTAQSNSNAGIVVAFPLGGGFFLQPELFYSGQGSNVNLSGVNGSYNLQYLNFPVLLKYVAPFHLIFETGPQLGFLLDATLKENGFPIENIKSQTNSSGYSWVFGVGCQLPKNFGLDVRYNIGLSHLQADNSNAYNDAGIKNNVFQVGIYYLFENLFPADKN
jgi:hypothetical protein